MQTATDLKAPASALDPHELEWADQRSTEEPLTAAEHNALSEVYIRHRRLDRALQQFHRALKKALRAGQAAEAIRTWCGMGKISQAQGRLEQAVECHQEAVHAAEGLGDPHLKAAHTNLLGTAYLLAGNFRAAIQSYGAASHSFAAGHLEGPATSLSGVGLAYYKLGEFAKAAEVYQQMVALLLTADDGRRHGDLWSTAYMGLGGTRWKQELHTAAVEHFSQALAVAANQRDNHLLLEACLALGNAHFSLGEHTDALEHYQRSLDIAEGLHDARNTSRALCGAGLCYYAEGEVQGAAKLFQNALACDTMVAPAGSSKVLSAGGQMVDEQLLLLIYWTLRDHAPQGTTQDLMGTMYIGLMAIMMNGGGVLTPFGLPRGFMETVVQAVLVATHTEGVNPASLRHTPYLQHYGVHILQQLVHQRALRHLVIKPGACDAVLAALAFPTDPAQGAKGIQSHTAAGKILKSLVNCPPPGSSRDDVCDLFLRSPALSAVLGRLPRGEKAVHEAHVRQTIDILTALTTLLTATNSPSKPPTPCHGVRSSPVVGRLAASLIHDVTSLVTAVCEVSQTLLGTDALTGMDQQLLEPCLRILIQCAKRSAATRVLIIRTLDPHLLDQLASTPLAPSSSVPSLALDLNRVLREHADLRFLNGLGSWADDTDDVTTDTTFDSLSSHSSLQYSGIRPSISIHRLPVGGGGDEEPENASFVDEWLSG